MKNYNCLLSNEEQFLLVGLLDSKWQCYGSEDIEPELDDALDYVFVETSTESIRITMNQISLDFFDEPEDYAILGVSPGQDESKTRGRGEISAKYQNQVIREIFLLESETCAIRDENPVFTYRSHDAVIFRLEHAWLSISRSGLWSQSLVISARDTRDGLELYDPLSLWESTLECRFEVSQNWVQLPLAKTTN